VGVQHVAGRVFSSTAVRGRGSTIPVTLEVRPRENVFQWEVAIVGNTGYTVEIQRQLLRPAASACVRRARQARIGRSRWPVELQRAADSLSFLVLAGHLIHAKTSRL
jgi:hypothetical protein